MEGYLKRVREQLCCNADKEYSSNYITYDHTNDQVNDNLDYFKRCKDAGLSPYKALLWFYDYLNNDYDI